MDNRGIPIVEEYKCLSITLDDCCSIKPNSKTLVEQKNSINKKLTSMNSYKMTLYDSFILWQTLIASKYLYGLAALAPSFKQVQPDIQNFMYTSLKLLLQIEGNPAKDAFFEVCTGN